jgi:hypothetical protein
MFKQLVLPMSAVALFIVIVGFMFKNPDKVSTFFNLNSTTAQNGKMVTIGNTKINLLMADTNETRQKGLGGTKSLADNQGMLFVFDKKDIMPVFWMKDMVMDIDIIWINDDKIVQIDKNVKAPVANTPDSKLELVKVSGPIDYVLEVSAGYSDNKNIKVGDQTKFDL